LAYFQRYALFIADHGDWDGFMRMINKAHPKKTDKWLKELLQRGVTITPEDVSSVSAIETLPLFAQLPDVAQGANSAL